MSGNEDLHPLLEEQKQHIYGTVSWSETKLMIGNQAIGEIPGFARQERERQREREREKVGGAMDISRGGSSIASKGRSCLCPGKVGEKDRAGSDSKETRTRRRRVVEERVYKKDRETEEDFVEGSF